MDAPIRLYVIHRYRLMAEAIARALGDVDDFKIEGVAVGYGTALKILPTLRVGILLFDASLDREPSRPRIRHLLSIQPGLKVIPFGLSGDHAVLQYLEAGALGCIHQGATLSQLVETVREVHAGSPACSPQVVASIMNRIQELAERVDESEPEASSEIVSVQLTPREQEVLDHLAKGLYNQEIANELGLALATVKVHVHKILKKLGVPNRRAASRRAYELGLLEPPS